MQDSRGSLHLTVGVCLATLILPPLGLKEHVSHLPAVVVAVVPVARVAVFGPSPLHFHLRP